MLNEHVILPIGKSLPSYEGFLLVCNLYKTQMFSLYTTINGQWHRMAYAPREKPAAERLLFYYQSNWPNRKYQLAPAGFTPDLYWVG